VVETVLQTTVKVVNAVVLPTMWTLVLGAPNILDGIKYIHLVDYSFFLSIFLLFRAAANVLSQKNPVETPMLRMTTATEAVMSAYGRSIK
jgi:hypothetical protein